MAKTDFQNGTIVTSSFLDSVFKTNGGHVHDGADNDGHAPAISLDAHVGAGAAQVQGILPFSNLPNLRLFNYRSGLSVSHEPRHITVGQGCATSANSISVASFVTTPIIQLSSSLRKRVLEDDGSWSSWVVGSNGGCIPVTGCNRWCLAACLHYWKIRR
jgi:hypothetical protein